MCVSLNHVLKLGREIASASSTNAFSQSSLVVVMGLSQYRIRVAALAVKNGVFVHKLWRMWGYATLDKCLQRISQSAASARGCTGSSSALARRAAKRFCAAAPAKAAPASPSKFAVCSLHGVASAHARFGKPLKKAAQPAAHSFRSSMCRALSPCALLLWSLKRLRAARWRETARGARSIEPSVPLPLLPFRARRYFLFIKCRLRPSRLRSRKMLRYYLRN